MSIAPLHLRRRGALLAVGVLALAGPGLMGCGGDDEPEADDPGTTTEEPTTGEDETTTTTVPSSGLSIVVTNDDGVASEGIDVLTEALDAAGHEVSVVAPADQQSGTGGLYNEDGVSWRVSSTVGGHPAVAVDGFPRDAARVAFEEVGVTPHLVVSGINEGQNLGLLVDVSGTVGAARVGVANGVPALALSAGLIPGEAEPVDPAAYELGAQIAVDWIAENLDALLAGEVPADVTNINIPSCTEGEPREMVEVPVATEGDPLAGQDCTSTLEDPADDVAAFTNGFVTSSVVPDEPATPPQPA